MRLLCLLFAVHAIAGCGGGPLSTPVSPTPTTAQTQPQTPAQSPPAASRSAISGFAIDTAFRALPGARVEIVDGPSAGTSTTADDVGWFTLLGTFDATTTFRASKDGYLAATQTWRCSVAVCRGLTGANPWLGFYLAVPAAPVGIAGDYTLTLTADQACTDLPASVRTRSYAATITPLASAYSPAGTLFEVAPNGVVRPFAGHRISLGVAGDVVGFGLYGDHNPFLIEQVAPNELLEFSGFGPAVSVGTAPPATIATTFEGSITYTAPVGAARCEAKNHRLILTRR